MVIQELSRLLEKRKTELVYLLENKGSDLELEKQHQIFGAINEIEIFLQTLDYYRNKEMNDEMDDIKLIRPEDGKNFLSNFKDKVAGKNKI